MKRNLRFFFQKQQKDKKQKQKDKKQKRKFLQTFNSKQTNYSTKFYFK